MGLMNLFRKDAAKELGRAEAWLAGGDPVRALETARRFLDDRDAAHRTRATALVQQARDALVAQAQTRAASAEQAGDLADAADWLHAALQHLGPGAQQAELEARVEALEARAEQQRLEDLRRADEETVEMPEYELDLEAHYGMLVDTLVEEVAERYEDQTPELQQALVDLNEGRVEAAREALEDLAARSPADPVLRFERGRCRLLQGDHAGAREDFEAAWPVFGDEPLDLAGSLSVPGLWAEAALGEGDAQAVLDRLEELAHPSDGPADLTGLYGQALIAAGDLPKARRWLAVAREHHPGRPDFSHDLAYVLDALGERSLAIQCLETAVAPSCATGNCARPPLHLPSLRALAILHLEEGGDLNRVEDLLAWMRQAQRGRLGAEDQRILARLHERKGDPQAAEAALAEARRLEAEQPSVPAAGAPVPQMGAGRAAL